MASNDLRRVRCAIVFADLVESVRLYASNEAAAIARWRRFSEQARSQWLPGTRGRLVRSDGDGLLMEFADAATAVAGAFALHRGMAGHNADAAGAEPLALRIGINVADVSFDAHEAYGAGVNLAQRITSLAQPGQTLASASTRDGLVHGVHAQIEDLGERYVKHIDEPVRTFRVLPADATPAGPDPAAGQPVGDIRPTLAVVPFQAMPAGADNHALGHAMADDIIAALARHPGLQVVSRLSTAAFRDTSLDWTRLRPLLGATFVLSGRYYTAASRVRLNLELAETRQGHVLWADTVRAEVQALFDGTDDLVPQVVQQVARNIAAFELARVRSLPMDTLESYALYLGAEGLMGSLVRQDFMRGREALEHLAERHPRQAAPHAMLAKWHVNHLVQTWSEDELADQRHGSERAARALDIDADSPLALAAAGLVQLNLKGDLDGARQLLVQALGGDPQNAPAWAWMSAVHSYSGEPDQARAAAARALLLSPLDPERYVFEAYAAMAHLAAADYATAVDHARQSLRQHALHSPSHRLLVGSLWLAGQHDEARTAAQRWLKAFPKVSSGARTARGLGEAATWRDHFADAVREAGVPSAPDTPQASRVPTQLF
ncbi:tetratricopeptide repeat protein [Rubrivivax sp. A210]|uniref:tetratricopeptide repeat protein n=1 Tax=Rubrivivax sp. A210 TaxID=2772301 RepID=UPI00191AD5BA|nr:tetratricopeptide repeat protein [Rubrivivax sp. A210]